MTDASGIRAMGEDTNEVKRLIHALEGFDQETGYKLQPYCLRNSISIIQEIPSPACIFWGADYIQYYNDAFKPFAGKTHPAALGNPLAITNPALFDLIGNTIADTRNGHTGKLVNFKWQSALYGYNTDPRFLLSFSPLYDEGNNIAGVMLCVAKAPDNEQNNNDKFRSLLMHSPIAMVVLKEPGHVVDIINEAMLNNIWYKELQDVQGKSLTDVFPDVLNQKFPELLEQVYRTGEPYKESEALVMRKNNGILTKHYVDFEYAPLRNADGITDSIIATVADVTEKVEARRKTEDAEERLRLAAEGTGLATWDLNLKTKDIIYSPRLAQLFGEDPTYRLTHAEMRERIHKDDVHEIVEKAFDLALQTSIYSYEARVVWSNNTIHWIRTTGKVIFDKHGIPDRMLGTILDITEQVMARRSEEEKEARFRKLVKGLPFAVYMCNADGYIDFYNDAAVVLWGREPVLGAEKWCGSFKLLDPRSNIVPRDQSCTARALRENRAMTGEAIVVRPDGERRHILSNPQPLYDASGKATGAMNAVIDITDQRLSAERLEKMIEERTINLKNANMALERSNEELEQFAFVTSHDLQEPLRKINTFAHMLYDKSEEVLNDEAKKYIDKITYSAQRMSRLINDLLNFSRLNRSDEKFTNVDLNEVMNDIKSDFELLINQKNAVVYYNNMPVIKAIPLQMNQLLYNLVSNALKFTNPAKQPVIHVTCHALPADEILQYSSLQPSLPYCEIKVSDNGIGFKQEYAQKIFEIFQRLNDKNAYEGTGIGLALCNKIVMNHDGLIFANSEENMGTDFHIFLPMAH